MKKRKGLKIALVSVLLVILLVVGIIVPAMFIPTIPSSLSISQHTKNPPKLIVRTS